MLQTLIESDPTEEEVQQFFEQYPRCLPEAGHYHNGLRADVVISKLPLHNDFITDFAYMSQNSQRVLIICIEIERPGKKLFRKDGQFTSYYQAAKQQVVDWNFWARHHVRDALKYFGKLSQHLPKELNYVQMHCILVM